MKSIILVIMAGFFCLSGCATSIPNSSSIQSTQVKPGAVSKKIADEQRPPQPVSAISRHGKQSLALSSKLVSPPREPSLVEEPDAIVKLDPKSGFLTPEMEAHLARIAGDMSQDEQLLIRLESYVPSGGSTALDIGISDRALHKVKARLQALGISPRRMLLGSYGGEHDMERDSRRHWVEIYVIRPSFSLIQLRAGNAQK